MFKHDEYLTCHPLQNSRNTVAAALSGCLSKETKKPPEGGDRRFRPASIYRAGYQNREELNQSNPMGSCKAKAPCKIPGAGRRRGVPRLLLQWRRRSNTMPCMRLTPATLPSSLKPNPSLKLSPNGVPRWPSSAGPAAHFALAVQRVTPLVPA